jgi:hypothetical protein
MTPSDDPLSARWGTVAVATHSSLGGVDEGALRLAVANADRLAALLRDRKGWWILWEDDAPHWCCGLHGAARLLITPEPDGFLMFIYDRESWVIPRLELVEAWLDEHEHEYEGLTPMQVELKKYLDELSGAEGGGSPASG